ncbi:MAG: Ig-like domain-containing protein [Pirellulaceae bacterium]
MLEHLNRMRTDPQGELGVLFSSTSPLEARDALVQEAIDFFSISGPMLASQWSSLTPVAPLAWNETLFSIAESHNNLMVQFDDQQHQFPGEGTLEQRLNAANYNYVSAGENVFAFAESVLQGHASFAIDWGDTASGLQDPPDHRINMMNASFQEVGIAIRQDNNPATNVGPFLVSQEFGRRTDFGGPVLLGVVYADTNGNGRYDAGEGLPAVTLSIVGPTGSFTATTMSAGGYQIQVPAGTYSITASGPPLNGTRTVADVTVSNQNVKADIESSTSLQSPVANDDTATVDEDGSASIAVLDNDSDADGTLAANTVQIVDTPDHGTVQVASNGRVTYRPAGNYVGNDTFSYRVQDNDGLWSEAASVSIVVRNVNDPPTVADFAANTLQGVAITLDVRTHALDIDDAIDFGSLQITTQPSHGTVTAPNSGRFAYTPDGDFVGDEVIRFTVRDQSGGVSNTATITVHVASNTAPVAASRTMATSENQVIIVDVLPDVRDPQNNIVPATLRVVTSPQHGVLVKNASHQYVYTPVPGFVGIDRFTYMVADAGLLDSNEAVVTIYVTNATRPWQNPVDPFDVSGDGAVTILDVVMIVDNIGATLGERAAPPFLDVDHDGLVAPLDYVLVVAEVDRLIAQQSAISSGGVSIERVSFSPRSVPPRPLLSHSASVDALFAEAWLRYRRAWDGRSGSW